MSLYSKDLLKTALLEPAKGGCERLAVVSGYSSASMVSRHFEELKELGLVETKIELIIGMTTGRDGISARDHHAYVRFMDKEFRGRFTCSYYAGPPSLHSKVYIWYKGNRPTASFVGSANYTQNAFGGVQKEVLGVSDPELCDSYFKGLIDKTVYCNHIEADQYVHQDSDVERMRASIAELAPAKEGFQADGILLPLVAKGEVPERSGLNWGQRPEYNRDPNQAYLSVPAEVQRSGFFPERGRHFTVITDDDKSMICVRAQDNGKAIQTPTSNSLLGEYFRNRLGLASGALVKLEDLERYGRQNVAFYKIDDDTYYLDFSKHATN